jgi:hypothetical protein
VLGAAVGGVAVVVGAVVVVLDGGGAVVAAGSSLDVHAVAINRIVDRRIDQRFTTTSAWCRDLTVGHTDQPY